MKELQEEISSDLRQAAAAYARAGMALMRAQAPLGSNPQAAVGNLAIATELILKSFVAKQDLTLLFDGVDLELRCALSSPEAMPKSFRALRHELDLRSSAYKTRDFASTIKTFFVFFPELKQQLRPHLDSIQRIRNICVHSAYVESLESEVHRAAYLFLSVINGIKSRDEGFLVNVFLGDPVANEQFLAEFDSERKLRVDKAMVAAKKKAASLSEPNHWIPDDWCDYPWECPVCGSDGNGLGETEPEPDFDRDEDPIGVILTFRVEAFRCDECGLELADVEEMMIAGMELCPVDRSDELDKWYEDNPPDDDDAYDRYYER